MAARFSITALALASVKHPRRTLLVWLIAAIAGFGLCTSLIESGTNEGQGAFIIKPESVKADDLLEKSGLRGKRQDTELMVISHPSLTVDSEEFSARVGQIHSQIVALNAGEEEILENPLMVPNPFALPPEVAEVFFSRQRDATFIPITIAGKLLDARDKVGPIIAITEDEANLAGDFEIGITGAGSISQEFNEISERDLLQGESFGIAAAVIILIVVFRALGSVWIPIVLAIFSISIANGLIAVFGQFYDNVPFFVTNFITMIGLAVGIDYSLFIIARYREERARGRPKLDAIAHSSGTASRAVFFSGLTVVFALVGMLIVPTTIFFSMALGAILVVLASILMSLTFLPALLSIYGDRVNSWRVPFLSRAGRDPEDTTGGFWNFMTRAVLRAPIVYLIVVGGALIALTVPSFNMNLGFNGVETLPDEVKGKQVFLRLQNDFDARALGQVSSVDVVVTAGASDADTISGVERLAASILEHEAFGDVGEFRISEDGSVGVLEAFLSVAADDDKATTGVEELRANLIPAAGIPNPVWVSGTTAFNVDFFNLVNTWNPIVIPLVLALSFLLLLGVFRSLIVPIKAIILNLLSVGAAYGLLVLVFQEGVAPDFMGFQQVDVIEAWLPLFLFTVLFGLSMDYEVFLLSRIKERYDETSDNEGSIAFGLRSTAGIITGAALIMVSVFAGFASGSLVMFQQFGFGLAAAVLVDATIIRAVLVPSTMKLLGRHNWYLPAFLDWLPTFTIDTEREAPEAAGGPAGDD